MIFIFEVSQSLLSILAKANRRPLNRFGPIFFIDSATNYTDIDDDQEDKSREFFMQMTPIRS